MGRRDGTVEVIARVAWIEGDSVLVCRNKKHGHCFLPGGHVEFGETAAGAACRELLEETGAVIEVTPPLHVFEARFTQNQKARHELCVVFHVARAYRAIREVASREEEISFEVVKISELEKAGFVPDRQREWLQGRVDGAWSTV